MNKILLETIALTTTFSGVLFSCNSLEKKSDSEQHIPKYNVLFIMSDDLNDNIGCYGHKIVKTPNIDNLAAKGVMYNSAYCQMPLSGPSRVSMLTGLRPDMTNVIINETDFRDYIPKTITLPQLFINNGYFTARTGKLFHYGVPGDIGTDGLDDKKSWQKRVNPKGRDKWDEDKVINFTPDKHLGSALSYLAAEGTDEEQTDGMVATEAIKMMSENKDKPFFIAAGFFRPHCPYIAPKKYFDLYDTSDISLPPYSDIDREDIPEMALWTNKKANYGLNDSKLKTITKSYYASISFMDAQVGRLLDALDSLGLAEKTIVVFMSDHGYNLGEHGMWHKFNLFEEANKIPMVMYIPGMNFSNKKVDQFVEMIDVYPTLAEVCGLKAPEYLHGTSMIPVMNDPTSLGKTAAVMLVGRSRDGFFDKKKENGGLEILGRSVRTKEWRYTEWDGGNAGAELYDHINDPYEYINIVGNPEYEDVIKELKVLLAVKENAKMLK